MQIEERKRDSARLSKLQKAALSMSTELKSAPFRSSKSSFVRHFFQELGMGIPAEIRHLDARLAVEGTMDWFAKHLCRRDKFPSRYGCIVYPGLPKALPNKETAIALSLADRVSFWRRDGLSEGSLSYPHKPTLTSKLPWKAIAEFALASVSSTEDGDATSIQGQVTKLARNVSGVY